MEAELDLGLQKSRGASTDVYVEAARKGAAVEWEIPGMEYVLWYGVQSRIFDLLLKIYRRLWVKKKDVSSKKLVFLMLLSTI